MCALVAGRLASAARKFSALSWCFHLNAGDSHMRRLLHAVLVVFFAAAPGAFAAPQAKSASPNPGPMARQVRSEFLYSWNAYKQYAWGHDELKPLTQSYRDWYDKPLQMTAVDALDTLVLMGLTDEADKTGADRQESLFQPGYLRQQF